jgi:hypothetical protein
VFKFHPTALDTGVVNLNCRKILLLDTEHRRWMLQHNDHHQNASLSQGSGETGSFKFLGAMITVWVPIFLICWFGELLTEQVLLIFCVTAYYPSTIKHAINKRTNKLTINHKVFSEIIFYCSQRATCFSFFINPSSGTSVKDYLV